MACGWQCLKAGMILYPQQGYRKRSNKPPGAYLSKSLLQVRTYLGGGLFGSGDVFGSAVLLILAKNINKYL